MLCLIQKLLKPNRAWGNDIFTTLLRCFFVHYNWLFMYVSIFLDSTVVSYWVIVVFLLYIEFCF